MVQKIKKIPTIQCSHEQAQDASKQHAEKSNKLAKIEAKMNEEVNQVKTNYSEIITQLKAELEETKELLKQYAKEQRHTWGGKKSFEMLHSILQFRSCNPKVCKPEDITWELVLENMKKHKSFKQFIRVKEEINKEAILSLNPSDKKDSSLLKQLDDECFISIERAETFFVTPKKESLN